LGGKKKTNPVTAKVIAKCRRTGRRKGELRDLAAGRRRGDILENRKGLWEERKGMSLANLRGPGGLAGKFEKKKGPASAGRLRDNPGSRPWEVQKKGENRRPKVHLAMSRFFGWDA